MFFEANRSLGPLHGCRRSNPRSIGVCRFPDTLSINFQTFFDNVKPIPGSEAYHIPGYHPLFMKPKCYGTTDETCGIYGASDKYLIDRWD